nr:hypothetical protein [Cupriavidus sp. USMAA2-4]
MTISTANVLASVTVVSPVSSMLLYTRLVVTTSKGLRDCCSANSWL